jgi:threonine/homoserine/homoserine lactone efflux protein
MWTGARERIDSQTQPAMHAFRQGFLVNLLNPKSALFAAAVLIVVFPENMRTKVYIDRVASLILGSFGARLLLSR